MSTIRVNAIQDTAGVERYTARAWVNFNGTGTVAIRASGNVSSITDNGVGDYTVNFAVAMADANYGFSGFAGHPGANTASYLHIRNTIAPTASALRVSTLTDGGTYQDSAFVGVAVFR